MSLVRITHNVSFQATKTEVHEALNWCFENFTGNWSVEHVGHVAPSTIPIYANSSGKPSQTIHSEGRTSMSLKVEEDRDAVLFKTFWNDR